jgi:DNA invertase Pin-like site-specific DNA recombinase
LTPSPPPASRHATPTSTKASGTLEQRPQLDAALSHLRAGDVLVVTKLDMMDRSVKHLCSITEQLRESGAHLKVLDQGIDTTTPVGRLVYHVLAAVAEFEHDLIVERTQSASPRPAPADGTAADGRR